MRAIASTSLRRSLLANVQRVAPPMRSLVSFQRVVIEPPRLQTRFMSGAANEKKEAPADETTKTEATASDETKAAPEGEQEAEPELTAEQLHAQQIEELQATVSEYEDRWKRALAEQENTRHMAQREIATAKKFAVQAFAKSMIEVSDNLGLAIEHTPADQIEGDTNPSLKTLYEGIQMTEQTLLSALGKHGVTKFNPLGEDFDHNFHNALFEMPDAEKKPGSVCQVIKTGFMLNDRVLRAADVGVVKK